MSDRPVTYERPVQARLLIRLDNGDEWEAQPADVCRFGYIRRDDAHWALVKLMKKAMPAGIDIVDTPLNCIRYASEHLIFCGIESFRPDDEAEVVSMIRELLGASAEKTDESDGEVEE